MNEVTTLWIVAAMLCAAMSLMWVTLRMKHHRALVRQHARHVQRHQAANRHLEQAKRQIEQLQHDLAAERLRVKRLTTAVGVAAPSPSRSAAKTELERQLDEATAANHRLPKDGFANTLPSPPYPGYNGLLFT